MNHKYISHFSIHVSDNSEKLTTMEREMLQSLLKNKNSFTIDDFTIINIAEKLNVSTTSLHRLSKKLGYSSFTFLKKDFFTGNYDESDEEEEYNYLHMIEDTYQIASSCITEKMLKAMYEAKKITIYGMGMSRYISKIFQIKLSLLNIPSEQYDDSRFMKLSTQILEPKKDMIFVLSRSGCTTELIDVLTEANQRNIESILVTESKDTVLEKLATYVVYTSHAMDRNDNVDTRMNAHIAMDLIVDAFLRYKKEINK